ncbi:MAG: DUF2059 domain-containing protein [Reyranellaceae bacterium]
MRFPALLLTLLFVATTGPVAAQPAPDPAALVAAKSLMSRTGVEGLMQQQLSRMPAHVKSIFATIDLGPDKDEWIARYADLATRELEQRLPRYLEQVTALYACTFTVDELRELNAFYDSTLGRKVIAAMPVLMRESSELSQQMTAEAIRETFRVLAPELEKHGVQPPK